MKRIYLALTCSIFTVLPAFATEFTYSLLGTMGIVAEDNAVKFMSVKPVGELVIADDGAITGQGVLVFSYMSPCQWRAPVSNDDYNCVIAGVDDGAFLISGQVTEWINRHEDDNPLKDGIFAFAEPRASERPDLAPYRISLTLTQTTAPAEDLLVWGLTSGRVEGHVTGASAIGTLVSGLFNQPFEIVALPQELIFNTPLPPNLYGFSGKFTSGTVVSAGGIIGLTIVPRAALPWKTDQDVYGQYWDMFKNPGEFTAEELNAMQITQQDSRADAAQDILDAMGELQENDRIPLSVWLSMSEAFGVPSGGQPDPGMDPLLLEALDRLGGGGN